MLRLGTKSARSWFKTAAAMTAARTVRSVATAHASLERRVPIVLLIAVRANRPPVRVVRTARPVPALRIASPVIAATRVFVALKVNGAVIKTANALRPLIAILMSISAKQKNWEAFSVVHATAPANVLAVIAYTVSVAPGRLRAATDIATRAKVL